MKNGSASRPVAIWLLVGVGLLIIQALLGGITRLTGSGLSITEWDPIMGVLPPANEQQWNEAFAKYKLIAQYKYLNPTFTLADFKSIFFWEWLHRLWARLIGFAFIVPFIIFVIRKKIKREMIRPLIILFLLGVLQALVGWIMVMSGLEDSQRIYVSPYRLAIHFILALVLICYALWFALQLLVPAQALVHHGGLKKFTAVLIALLTLQLIYGAFMAGLKAAPYAPTWPDINGSFFPRGLSLGPLRQYVENPLMVHFIHRNLAYVIFIGVLAWFARSLKIENPGFKKTTWLPLLIVSAQIIIGIFTVLNSPHQHSLVWWGTAHQFVAVLLLLSLVTEFYLLHRNNLARA